MSGTVVVDAAAIAAIVRNPHGPVIAAFRSLVTCVESTAKQNAKVDTGVLRASIRSEVHQSDSEINGLVTAEAPYADYVEKGTGIYGPSNQPIRPKKGTYLVFKGQDGGTVFAQQVAGSRAAPFMAPALETCLGRLGG